MTTMVIALGEDDDPLPGNEDLPHYEDVRKGIVEMAYLPKVFELAVPVFTVGELRIFYFRTTDKDIGLKLLRTPSTLLSQTAVLLNYAFTVGKASGVVLKQGERQTSYVTLVAGSHIVTAFHFSDG